MCSVVWVTTEAGPKSQNGQSQIFQFVNFEPHKKSLYKISTKDFSLYKF